ncbi:MAG: enoyl-CoA hydratase/isomerase family protein [Proteobacteria bacterium]|nr:enoyl-CoA hydratase/isomerase family protein [Pseudomonadota bacterium]
MSDYKKLIFDRQDQVTTITLNRPKVHNALDRELSAELKDAILKVRADRDCRVMVLQGAGETFCAGDDIKEFNEWRGDESYWQVRLYQETVQLIEDLTPVTIAAVDGVCTGGGLELTLVCDFVVATDRSRWGMPEIDWDITPGWGGISRIPKFAGRRKAKEWNLIGMLFTAEKAERYDLVNRVVAPEELSSEVAKLTEIMLQKHPMTVRRTKFALNQSADLPVKGALAFEVPIMPYARGSSGLKDFTSKEGREKRREMSKNFWSD